MTVQIIRGNALNLPLEDNSVDLVVTSPPYFGLRSYSDGCPDCAGSSPDSYRVKVCSGCGETTSRVKCHNGCGVPMKLPTQSIPSVCATCNGTGKGHYDGQLGSEATPAEFVDALIAATREMVRVCKPSGSIFVNLGDKYSGAQAQNIGGANRAGDSARTWRQTDPKRTGIPNKSLMGLPWRYALRCIDDLGLILRAEIIWAKPNGLPESVTDRVRRSHETWFHFTLEPRYYSAVDTIREEHVGGGSGVSTAERKAAGWAPNRGAATGTQPMVTFQGNPLGKLPGSVWTIPTQPLTVPASLGVDHFAAFPMDWPRRIIRGWSPSGICTACGEGRRPVTKVDEARLRTFAKGQQERRTGDGYVGGDSRFLGIPASERNRTITGESCGCETPTAPTRPATVLDPFGGTGTTALVAHALGRHGITVDMSADYCRLAEWRCNDPAQLAAALQVDKPEPVAPDQLDLFGEEAS